MLLRRLLISEVRIRRRRWESIWLLRESRVLLCYERWRLLLLEAGGPGRTVVEEATLSRALVAVIAAGVRITMLSASALRRRVMPAANLAESKRTRVARAAQRRAGHVPVGPARIQPWVLVLLLASHLIDERRLLLLLLWLEVANGCRLGGLLAPGLLLLLLRRCESWLLLLGLLTAVATSASTIAVACSWRMGSRCCLVLASRSVA